MDNACVYRTQCPVFARIASHELRESWAEKYCDDDFSRCIRYQWRRAERTIGNDVLPDGTLVENERS